jgi:hypothetical protein
VAALGWDGTVTALGQWGPGIADGGASLRVQGVRVDVHFRNMAAVRNEIRETHDGRFRIEANPVLLAGMPSYVLAGEAPEAVGYPPALRANAPGVWWEHAQYAFSYARVGHAEHDRTLFAGGLVARAVAQTAHAVLAARGQWAPANEKTLLDRAGLGDLQCARAGRHDEVERILARCAEGVAVAEREGDR